MKALLSNRQNYNLPFLILIIISFFVISCTKSNSVIIYRDVWGIPHIFADSDKNVAFAFGYAQAGDRLQQLLSAYRYAEGTLAEAFGERYLEADIQQRTWQHASISQAKFTELPEPIQALIKYFVAGIKAYLAEHPDEVPPWAPEIKPWQVVALARTFIWDWPLDQAKDDLRRHQRNKAHLRGSNQWVVRAERTAVNAPIALIDPHLPFKKEGHWIEARLHGDHLDVCGMAIVGTPFIALGHNRKIAWAATTGGPDCGDVYELELNPNNPDQYRYDNQWQNLTNDTLKIKVKKQESFQTIEKIIQRSHFGPISQKRGNRAYAIKLPYSDQVQIVTQVFQMNTAQNLAQFKKALAMCQMMPQNITYADIQNNIYYARTGRVPVRPVDYEWNLPVPGTGSDSEWQGIHAHEDLVQILNPDCGFMQNCNISPGTMLPNSPLTADKYPDYIYNVTENKSNPRGGTALKLLQQTEQMTVEQAMQIALDTSVDGYEKWQQLLSNTYQELQPDYPDLTTAVELILSWNGRADQDNDIAALYRFWRHHCQKLFVTFPETGNSSFSMEHKRLLLIALQQAKAELIRHFGDFKVQWGRTVRLVRGEKTWPVSGGSFGDAVSTLRAVWGTLSPTDGITYIDGGQSCCMLVILKKPIESYSILPYGQHDDPHSKYFDDQAEKLFSPGQFKSTYFNKEELMNNLESKLELKVPKF